MRPSGTAHMGMVRHLRRLLLAFTWFVAVAVMGYMLCSGVDLLNGTGHGGLSWFFEASSGPCQPRQNIVFLKTHKCASSTSMNILLRYGVGHNLTFVLPKSVKTNYIGHPQPFHRNFIVDLRRFNLTNNILTHHTRFNKAEIGAVVPSDSVYVTSLRRPEDLFESLFSYYGYERVYKKNLTHFLKDAKLIETSMKSRLVGRIGINQMSFDLGLAQEDFGNATAVSEFIKSIERDFSLVMITERLDESLILLKHLLCWTTEDFVAFKVNARESKYKVPMTSEMRQSLRKLNSADAKLYDYFADVFEKKVVLFGRSRMKAEVEELKTLRMKYYERCVDAEEPVVGGFSDEVLGFKLKEQSEVCRHLTMTELEFHALVYKRQEDLLRRLMAGVATGRPSASKNKGP